MGDLIEYSILWAKVCAVSKSHDTDGFILAVLDPLQKLFGGGHASSTALAFSQVQAAGPMAPSAAAGTGGPSPASSLPSSVPRLSGLPPFRNAAGATQTSASPKQGKLKHFSFLFFPFRTEAVFLEVDSGLLLSQ